MDIEVNTQDMESEDYEFFKGLKFLMDNHISELGYEYDQTFSLEVHEFGVTEVPDLITNGRNIVVMSLPKPEMWAKLSHDFNVFFAIDI